MTWRERRVADVADLINGYPFESAHFADEGPVPLVRIRDILIEPFQTFLPTHVIPESAYIQDRDVVIGMDGDFNLVYWQRGRAALNQRLCLLRANGQADTRFLAYALPDHLKVINDLTYATTVKHLSSGQVRDVRLMAPNLAAQSAIADYLDRETALIDKLIEEQQRLIEMLRERRGAVADQLLNPPGHMQPLKRIVADVTVGIVVNPSAWYAEEGVPALRGLNVRSERVICDDLVYLTPDGDELHTKSRLRTGDVVMVRTGQAGTAAVIPHELDGANAIDLLIVRPGPRADPAFLAAYFNAPSTREKITHGSVGAIQGHFNVSALRELEFPSIDIAEQRDRARNWSVEAGRIDALIVESDKFIELARERRSALITAAVTGQIDVREATGCT